MKEAQIEDGKQAIIDRLREENAELKATNLRLLFALQDAWPYIHGWCTIRSIKRRVEFALFGSYRTPI